MSNKESEAPKKAHGDFGYVPSKPSKIIVEKGYVPPAPPKTSIPKPTKK